MTKSILVGYDPNKDETSYPAVSECDCQVMKQRQGWTLKRVEPTNDKLLTVRCVFQGKVNFYQDKGQE